MAGGGEAVGGEGKGNGYLRDVCKEKTLLAKIPETAVPFAFSTDCGFKDNSKAKATRTGVKRTARSEEGSVVGRRVGCPGASEGICKQVTVRWSRV